jgi:hypothetical protein
MKPEFELAFRNSKRMAWASWLEGPQLSIPNQLVDRLFMGAEIRGNLPDGQEFFCRGKHL